MTSLSRLLPLLFLFVSIAGPLPAQTTGVLRGQVLDPSGAVVPKASVSATGPNGVVKAVESETNGQFTIPGLAVGDYTVRVAAPGFGSVENQTNIAGGRVSTLDFHLTVAADRQEVTVAEQETAQVDIDPANNASAMVLKGDDLNVLADNATDLATDLQALAGPGAGPNGGQILVDGFSGAQLPPKESIREIRVNSNPFSAEYDRSGQGRVEILTRPGTDKLHGSAMFAISDSALNARNPFSTSKPPTQMRQYQGNIGGSFTKKSSFTFDGGYVIQDSSSLIKAKIVENFQPVDFTQNVVTPSKYSWASPRFDYAVTPNLTLTARYNYNHFDAENNGVGQFTLLDRGNNFSNDNHSFYFVETQVIGTRLINESRFQYNLNLNGQKGVEGLPALNVQGAFNGGGSTGFDNHNTNNNYEFQNNSSYTRGRHLARFGVRIRANYQDNFSKNNFNGTYTFASLDSYIRTLQGTPDIQQYSVTSGQPGVNIHQWDVSPFLQDDFRYKPNLTISLGLRYETQTNIEKKNVLAPRVGVAWGVGRNQAGGRPPKTVLRLGWGMFYERINQSLPLQALKQNGTTQRYYVIKPPSGILNQVRDITHKLPEADLSEVPQAIYTVDTRIEAPKMYQTAVTLERQLPRNITLSATYTNSRGVHQLRSVNVNAPLLNGSYPTGVPGQLFRYGSSALYRQNQLTLNVNARVNPAISLFGYYNYSRTNSDSDGSGSFPVNNQDLGAEWGRASYDYRHRSTIGGNINLPFKFQVSPNFNFQSSNPVNIVTGTDLNSDTIFNDRPAFATVPANPAIGVIASRWGVFNADPLRHPEYGSVIIPRNYGVGYGFFGIFVRLTRTWTFGEAPSGAPKPPGNVKTPGRYSIQLGISSRNTLNHTNPTQPVATLTSPFFGQALQSALGSNANRRLEFSLRLGF